MLSFSSVILHCSVLSLILLTADVDLAQNKGGVQQSTPFDRGRTHRAAVSHTPSDGTGGQERSRQSQPEESFKVEMNLPPDLEDAHGAELTEGPRNEGTDTMLLLPNGSGNGNQLTEGPKNEGTNMMLLPPNGSGNGNQLTEGPRNEGTDTMLLPPNGSGNGNQLTEGAKNEETNMMLLSPNGSGNGNQLTEGPKNEATNMMLLSPHSTSNRGNDTSYHHLSVNDNKNSTVPNERSKKWGMGVSEPSTVAPGREKRVATELTNVALNKPAKQSSLDRNWGNPQNVVDGDPSTDLNTCTHTRLIDYDPNRWWRVDLRGAFQVQAVKITNRGDCCGERLADFNVYVMQTLLDPSEMTHDPATLCVHRAGSIAQGGTERLDCLPGLIGRYVSLVLPYNKWELNFCEIEVLAGARPVSGSIPSGMSNVALGKTSWMSSFGNPASLANDGDLRQTYIFCAQTTSRWLDHDDRRFWRVNLGRLYTIYTIKLYNRKDCCTERLKDFYIYVAKTASDLDAENLPNEEECYYRKDTVVQGAIVTFKCYTPVVGRFLTLYMIGHTDLSDPQNCAPLHFCELEVYAKNFNIVNAGQACGGNLEDTTMCEEGVICTAGQCKVPMGGDCNETSPHCLPPSVCENGKCWISYSGECQEMNQQWCRWDTSCIGNRCKIVRGAACSGNQSDACEPSTVCDSTSVCKKAVDTSCNETSDCVSGADCGPHPMTCQCQSGFSQPSSDGKRCSPLDGKVLGACLSGAAPCGDPNAECGSDDKCTCKDSKPLFHNNYTCNVNSSCASDANCGYGNICTNRRLANSKCVLGYDQTCPSDFYKCISGTTCDKTIHTCRIDLSSNCTLKPTFCIIGAVCEDGQECKMTMGGECTTNDQCLRGAVCQPESGTKKCRMSVGGQCQRGSENSCVPTAQCDEDYMCRQMVGQNCEQGKLCALRSECDQVSNTCKVKLRQDCTQYPDSCGAGAVCDHFKKCGLSVGSTCNMADISMCVSGGSCQRESSGQSVCRCNAAVSDDDNDKCSPKINQVGGTCRSNYCADPNAKCLKGKCQCNKGFAVEPPELTCGIQPGSKCVPGAGKKCLSGSVCDAGGACRLLAGQDCYGNDQVFCSIHSICEENVCKLNSDENCSGTEGLCRNSTVCDSLKKCKSPAGARCSDLSAVDPCMAGSTCEDTRCQCLADVAQETAGQTCVPKPNKVGGACSSGCDDPHSECVEHVCQCAQTYIMDYSFTCKRGSGQECTGNDECAKGTLCDNNICKNDVGGKCTSNDQCIPITVCDTDSTCHLDTRQNCVNRQPYCRHETICDNTFFCGVPLTGDCSEIKSCVAGAKCIDNKCQCRGTHAFPRGMLCAPTKGRVGSECDAVSTCLDTNAVCKGGYCECETGPVRRADFTCPYLTSTRTNLIKMAIGVAIAILFAGGILALILVRRQKRQAKMETVETEMNARSKMMLALTEGVGELVAQVNDGGGASTIEMSSMSEMTSASSMASTSGVASTSEMASEISAAPSTVAD